MSDASTTASQTAMTAALRLLGIKIPIIDAIPARTRRLTPEEVEEVDRQLLKILGVLARIKIKEAATTTPADQEASTALFRELAAALRRLEELTMGRGPTA